jgi:hypothetical protein
VTKATGISSAAATKVRQENDHGCACQALETLVASSSASFAQMIVAKKAIVVMVGLIQ